jgi:membrane-associated phospholipid phosphatase
MDRFMQSLFADPLLWGGIICLTTSLVLLRTSRLVRGAERWSTLIGALLPFALYAAVLVVGDKVVKPAFAVPRPPQRLAEPPLTAFVEGLMADDSDATPDSMPSGFVMRQVAVFHFLNWIAFSNKPKPQISRRLRNALSILNGVVLLFVCLSRMYLGAHTFLDVSVALGIGTVLFYLVTMPPYNLVFLHGNSLHRVYISSVMFAASMMFLFLIGFAGNYASMAILLAYCAIYLGFLYSIAPLVEVQGMLRIPRSVAGIDS